jgi:hypothetical protein
MKKLLKASMLAALAGAFVAFAGLQTAGAQGERAVHMTVEKNTDRPGGDYDNFAMERPQAAQCRAACKADTQCKAYTYVKPGIQGPDARCWLKYTVPEKVESDCCESGVKVE